MARRRRSPAATAEEESYFVSLNDLLVGMLFVFIILLMIFALNYQKEEQRLNELLEGRENQRTGLLGRFEEGLNAAGTPVEINEKTGELYLGDSVVFDSGLAELKPEGRKHLRAIAKMLARDLPCYGGPSGRASFNCSDDAKPILEAVYVEGHTDSQPIHNNQYRNNWELSSARALTAYQFMTEAEPSLQRIRNASEVASLFGVSAYADKRPIGENTSEEGRAKNRRISFRFLISPPRSTEEAEQETAEQPMSSAQ